LLPTARQGHWRLICALPCTRPLGFRRYSAVRRNFVPLYYQHSLALRKHCLCLHQHIAHSCLLLCDNALTMRNIFLRDGCPTGSDGSTDSQMLPVANATTPYWRTQLHPIDEHRSSHDLPTGCDIVIIGAGLAGVSTAYHLSAAAGSGAEVPSIVMLEARQVCSGATGRNGVSRATARCMLHWLTIIRVT